MKNYIFLICSTLLIASCGNLNEDQKSPFLPNELILTDNEDKGVKEILAFYGGSCISSFGFYTSEEDEQRRYFELELSKSEAIELFVKNPQMPASNIAFIFYKKLNQDERKKYDEIHSILIFADNDRMTFKFPTYQLERVEQKMNVVNKVVEIIKNKNFEALRPILKDNKIFTFSKDELIENLKIIDPQLGNITEGFRFYGFRINKANDGSDVLHISGALIRDKQSNEFSVDLDFNGTDENIYFLRFKY